MVASTGIQGNANTEIASLAEVISSFPPEVRADVLLSTEMHILSRMGLADEAQVIPDHSPA